MKKILYILICVTLLVSINSCMITKTPVGNYTQQTGEKYRYAKGKQVWLFWGLIPCGRTAVATPASGDCMVRTGFTFGDFLISGITGGIVTTYTIKTYAKRETNQSQNNGYYNNEQTPNKKGSNNQSGNTDNNVKKETKKLE